jgi:hypothetical protein
VVVEVAVVVEVVVDDDENPDQNHEIYVNVF